MRFSHHLFFRILKLAEHARETVNVILSQGSIKGIKSSSQCVQQILKLTHQGYMPLCRRGGV